MARHNHILITGASSGIGAALAEFYAGQNRLLSLTGRESQRLAKAAQSCREKGAEVKELVLDVTDRQAMEATLKALDCEKPIDLVIANAGISGGTGGNQAAGGAPGEPWEQVQRIFDINLTGVLNTIRPLLPAMLERKSGQLALMSSLASFSGWPGAPSYSASKGAVRLYGEALRGSLAGTGVKVNVICPGFIRTPMTEVNDYAMPFMMDPDRASAIIAKGLEKDKGRIAFPWQSYLLAGFFGMLPYILFSAVSRKLPEKPENIE